MVFGTRWELNPTHEARIPHRVLSEPNWSFIRNNVMYFFTLLYFIWAHLYRRGSRSTAQQHGGERTFFIKGSNVFTKNFIGHFAVLPRMSLGYPWMYSAKFFSVHHLDVQQIIHFIIFDQGNVKEIASMDQNIMSRLSIASNFEHYFYFVTSL